MVTAAFVIAENSPSADCSDSDYDRANGDASIKYFISMRIKLDITDYLSLQQHGGVGTDSQFTSRQCTSHWLIGTTAGSVIGPARALLIKM